MKSYISEYKFSWKIKLEGRVQVICLLTISDMRKYVESLVKELRLEGEIDYDCVVDDNIDGYWNIMVGGVRRGSLVR